MSAMSDLDAEMRQLVGNPYIKSPTVDELQAEIERLRARLERISKSPDNNPDHLRWLAADALLARIEGE